jgi:NAD(P)-dependent dehydrogenase (short-subunit alcohol dehydrogenase family)
MSENGIAGAQVVGVACDRAPLEKLRAELGESFTAVSADAADPTVAGRLIDAHHPRVLVLNVGASPLMRPLQHHTWETFSVNWQTDVRIAFHWLRESLLKPLRPGSRVVVFSSGAALAGQAGQAVVDLVTGDAHDQDAYLLTTAGLRPLA